MFPSNSSSRPRAVAAAQPVGLPLEVNVPAPERRVRPRDHTPLVSVGCVQFSCTRFLC